MMRRMVVLLFSAIFILTACSAFPKDLNPFRQTIIDWEEFIKINGEEYERIRHGVIADPREIGQQIGTVNYKLSGNVTNPHYKPKDGDASHLDKGTIIYAVKNEPALVAVKDGTEINGYQVFYNADDSQSYVWHYQHMPKDQVSKVELYYRQSDGRRTLIKRLTDHETIKQFVAVLDDGQFDDTFSPNISKRDPTTYDMVFYTESSIANRYSMFFDGTHYYWHPSNTAILPDEIRQYLRQ